MTGTELCFSHNPNTAEAKRLAVTKGGATTYDRGLIPLEPIDFTDTKPILWLLADTINRVRKVKHDGTMDVKTANCIGQLTRVMLEAQREITIVERLERLEAQVCSLVS